MLSRNLSGIFLLFLVSAYAAVPIQANDDIARIQTESASRRESNVAPLHPGKTLIIPELKGPGVLRHFWFTVQSPNPRVYGGLVLRIWWDGEKEPSVEAPLSDFFGVGFGEERKVRSAAVEMTRAGLPGHAALNCWLPMPFESARIEIENQNPEEIAIFYLFNWEKVEYLDDDLGRFHAQWRRSNPVERGRHHTALVAEGEGQYIGLVYSIRRLEGGAWVEGGEDFYIDLPEDEIRALDAWDGSLIEDEARRVPEDARSIANQPMGPVRPTLNGIGGEDYFGTSWGFYADDRSLYHGVTLGPDEIGEMGRTDAEGKIQAKEGTAENEEETPEKDFGRMSAYRFHLLDPIRFSKNFRMIFRNHGWDVGSRADDITTLVMWYQHEPHRPMEPLPPLKDRLPEK